MDDETFNMSMRKYLKKIGVTSQQQIEEAVRAARDEGTLGDGPLEATTRVSVPGLGLDFVIDGSIALRDGK